MTVYLLATDAAARALFASAPKGTGGDAENLPRFRAVADYSETPELAPESPISGGEILFLGDGGPCLIDPEAEPGTWRC